MTSYNTAKPPGAFGDGPDIFSEIDVSSNPAYEKVPQFYIDNFPALFDKDKQNNTD